jgi:hypothetical protein
MVGYAKNHSTGTYRMYTVDNNSVVESRDVRWHDWTRPDPKRDVSFFVQGLVTLSETAGIDDKEAPSIELTSDDTGPALILPDDAPAESAAGRRNDNTTEQQEQEEAMANQKAGKLEREMQKLDTS